jgi:hypothetical protein
VTLKATISGSYTASITLTSATYANPVTVTGTVEPGTAYGLVAATPWTIINQGTERSYGGAAIKLGAGGSVSNAASGFIYGPSGVDIRGAAGTVINAGSMDAAANSGYAGAIYLYQGGYASNASTGRLTGHAGVVAEKQQGTVVNDGTVSAAHGMVLAAGGTITNNVSGTIVGTHGNGVYIRGGAGTVHNYGSIAGQSNSSAIYLRNGGSVTNAAGAVISGAYHGIDFLNAGAVTNAGSIVDSNPTISAVGMDRGGTVVNLAGGVISGGYGVYINHGGTITNAGTIGATGTHQAVDFYPGTNRLIVDPGAVFNGLVTGGNSAGSGTVSVLELASGAGTGTLAGLGSGIINFGSVAFDPGASWVVSLTGTGASAGELISGFATTDQLDLGALQETISGFANNTLSLTGSTPITIVPAGSYSGSQFTLTPSGTLSVACFCAGARILTDAGEVAVEELRAREKVISLTRRRPIAVKWIGSRAVAQAAAVCIAAGALGRGVPHRSLQLSPDHAVFIDGALIPVRYLVNGTTVRELASAAVTYFHVELEEHAALLAEGMAAESYLDTGNRSAFADAAVHCAIAKDCVARPG